MKIVLALTALLAITAGCQTNPSKQQQDEAATKSCCMPQAHARFDLSAENAPPGQETTSTEGMVVIPGGTFTMGAREKEFARADEFPNASVQVDSFLMDAHPVTNQQFAAFVEATGYVTTAEVAPDWEEIKQQLPPGTPKPADSLLIPASLVFSAPQKEVSLNNHHSWWKWMAGATGDNLRGRVLPSREKKTSPWFMFPGLMHRRMPNGQANACPQKPNGNMQPEVVMMNTFTPGAMSQFRPKEPTTGRANSPTPTRPVMAMNTEHLSRRLRPTLLACMTWPETYGSGRQIGTTPNIMPLSKTTRSTKTPKVLSNPMIPYRPTCPKKQSGAVPFYATIPTVQDTGPPPV